MYNIVVVGVRACVLGEIFAKQKFKLYTCIIWLLVYVHCPSENQEGSATVLQC